MDLTYNVVPIIEAINSKQTMLGMKDLHFCIVKLDGLSG